VGVGIVIRRKDEILLVRRRNVHGDGSWSTPGGHLDPGESPEECAVREAREETGVEVGSVRFLAITNDVFEKEALHYLTVWMEGDYLSGTETVAEEYEVSEVAWYAAHSLPDELFLPLQNLIGGRGYGRGSGGLHLRGKAV
jgi:8-oxo-dGTP diphosphatase